MKIIYSVSMGLTGASGLVHARYLVSGKHVGARD